ncbi:MAG: alanine racemase [Phycisphaeraceae bacterium]|nr:alanine racemase [Phycisphaeraceae bacterium]
MTLPEPVKVDPAPAGVDSWLRIDLTRIAANVDAFRRLLKSKSGDDTDRPSFRKQGGQRPALCAVVKKDAYGLGAEAVAHCLVKAGCDMLAVFSPDEAEALIQKAVSCPILLLSPLRRLQRTDALYRHAVADKLHVTVHDLEQLDQLEQVGQTYGLRLPVHLYLDTGMSRSGLNETQYAAALKRLSSQTRAKLVGVCSHLATADNKPQFAETQLETFERIIADHAADLGDEPIMLHLANTAGTLRDRSYHFDMVRIGLGLYGYGPDQLAPGPVIAETPDLLHCVSWMSRIDHVQQYPRRTPVGYGSTHRLKRASTLGIVPVGYADGYPLALSNKATVRVFVPGENGRHFDARVLGRVNMDQLIIDLTDAPPLQDGGEPGKLMNAIVQLICDDPAATNSLPRLAALADSHPWEMLCRLHPKLKRQYVR